MTQDTDTPGSYLEPGTIEALLDLSFTKFVTIRIVKLLYLLTIVLIGLGWLIGVITVAGQFGIASFGGLLTIVALTLLVFVEVIFARVGLELVVVLFRIGENTSAIAERAADRT